MHRVWPLSITDTDPSGFKVNTNDKFTADVGLKGRAVEFYEMALSPNKQAALASSELEQIGKTATLEAFQTLFTQLDLDIEAIISQVTGQRLGHYLAKPIQKFTSWQKASLKSTRRDWQEYVQEEILYFPPKEEVEDFIEDITDLSLAVDRLEARFKQSKLKS